MNAPVDHKPVLPQITAIEKKFGTGASYSTRDQAAILEGVLPEWLLRIRKLVPERDGGAFAARVIADLQKLRAELWPKVRFSEQETTPPVAAKQSGDH